MIGLGINHLVLQVVNPHLDSAFNCPALHVPPWQHRLSLLGYAVVQLVGPINVHLEVHFYDIRACASSVIATL